MRGRRPADVLDRVLASIIVADGGCWLWQGRLDPDGYARIWTRGKHHRAHRVVYERVKGRPITDGLVIDHLCKTRNCVNPAHMEPVTTQENVARGARCRCGNCRSCRHNTYMRAWYARRRVA